METSNISGRTKEEEACASLNTVDPRIAVLEKSLTVGETTKNPKVDTLSPGQNCVDVTTMEVKTIHATSTSLVKLAEMGDDKSILVFAKHPELFKFKFTERNERGDTALHVAANGGHLKSVVALLCLGANIDTPGNRLRTPLHYAVAQGHMVVAQHLVLGGAKVDAKDANGDTPLSLAAAQRNIDIVRSLLQNEKCRNEMAGFLTAEYIRWDFVEWFLEEGLLSVDKCNKDGDPIIVIAAKNKRWETVDLLLQKGACATRCREASESALAWASLAGEAHAVRQLLSHGAALRTQQVENALKVAQNEAVVRAFADVVPDHVRGSLGIMALVQAAGDGRLNTLVALLDAGIDVNTKNHDGVPVLSYAISRGQVESARALLQRGAHVNCKDKLGHTPLHWAAFKGHSHCVRFLLSAGASTTETNNKGKTPLDIASSAEVREILSGRL